MGYAQSLRDLATGSGNLAISGAANKPAILTFANSQFFWPGETVRMTGGTPNVSYTVARGADKVWYSLQPYIEGSPAGAFKRTDPSTGRGRGGANGSYWVPRARYYFYVALIDDSGVADGYYYTDTVAPLRGRHPYTKDAWAGQSWLAAAQTTQVISAAFGPIPDLGNRVAALDGEDPVVY